MNLKIIKYPDPRLSTPAKEVDEAAWDQARALSIAMKQFMKTLWGVPLGLAAPQVGHGIRLFIAEGEVYVNPKIIEKSTETYLVKEGCYSLEKNRFDYTARRHTWVILEYDRLNKKLTRKRFSGRSAQIIQHEVDHLEGRLCHESSPGDKGDMNAKA